MELPVPTPILPATLREAELVVRPMEVADAAAVHRWRNHPEVTRFQGWTPATVADVEAVARDVDASGYRQWVIEVEGAVAGDMGIGPWGAPQVELGIVLDPARQGRGVATRAARLLLGHGFGCGVHRVTARVDPRNAPSLALIERLGFRREGHEIACYWDPIDGDWTDEVLFALLAREWQAP